MDQKLVEIINNYIEEDLQDHLYESSLKDLGLDSMASIELLLEIEDAYNLSFPDELLNEETFSSAVSLWRTIISIKEENGVSIQ